MKSGWTRRLPARPASPRPRHLPRLRRKRFPRFDVAGALSRGWPVVVKWMSRSWLARVIGKNLRRRILLANLLGLAGLLFAMLYLSLHHGWLLDAKVDVVKTVSRITAEAIAYRAVNERAIFDPNRIPEKTLPRAQRDDALRRPRAADRSAPGGHRPEEAGRAGQPQSPHLFAERLADPEQRDAVLQR